MYLLWSDRYACSSREGQTLSRHGSLTLSRSKIQVPARPLQGEDKMTLLAQYISYL